MRLPTAITAVAALVLYCGLALALLYPALSSGGREWVGVPRDAELFMWYLRWVPFAAVHLKDPLVSNYIHYPGVVNAMWNTSIVFPSLVLAPLTYAFNVVTAYNGLVFLSFALSAWFAYLAASRFVTHAVAAFAAGLLYGFGHYMIAQGIGHAHLVIAVYPPLLFLLLDDLVRTQRWRAGIAGGLLGLATAAELLTSEEIVATAAVVAATGLVLAALLAWRQAWQWPRLGHAARGLAVALVVFAVLAAFPMKVQFLGPERVSGLLQAPNTYVTDLLGFFVPTNLERFTTGSAVALSAHFSGNGSENNAYLGVPILLVFVITVAWLRTRTAWWALLTLAAAALLSMGPRLHVGGTSTSIRLPWAAIQKLPLMENILPSRIMVFAFLCGGLLLALFIDAALRSRPALGGVGLAGAGLALLAIFPALPYPVSAGATPPYFTSAAIDELPAGASVLVTPVTGASAMRWQALAGMRFRQPGGTAFIPGPIFGPPPSPLIDALSALEAGGSERPLTPARRAALLSDLRRMGVVAVVAGPTSGSGPTGSGPASAEAAEVALLTDLLGRSPEQLGGVYIWREVS